MSLLSNKVVKKKRCFCFKHKLKLIDPIDYDSYISENTSTIRKDACSRQLILLPDDDIIYEEESSTKATTTSTTTNSTTKLPPNLNLPVSDCLKTYLKQVYRVEFKYAAYGESYYDLPGYRDTILGFNRLIDEKKFELHIFLQSIFWRNFLRIFVFFLVFRDDNGVIVMPEAFYEIDVEDGEHAKNSVIIWLFWDWKVLTVWENYCILKAKN